MNYSNAISLRKLSLCIAATLLGPAATVPQGRAAYTVTFLQVGANVVATGSGTLNTTALSFLGSGNEDGFVASYFADEVTGPAGNNSVDIYGGISGPNYFGTSQPLAGFAASGSGDAVGVLGSYFNEEIVVPPGYVSGDPLSDSSIYDGETLDSLNITPGTYIWSWGSGATADSFTVTTNAQSVPEPASLCVLGIGTATLLVRRRRTVHPNAILHKHNS